MNFRKNECGTLQFDVNEQKYPTKLKRKEKRNTFGTEGQREKTFSCASYRKKRKKFQKKTETFSRTMQLHNKSMMMVSV